MTSIRSKHIDGDHYNPQRGRQIQAGTFFCKLTDRPTRGGIPNLNKDALGPLWQARYEGAAAPTAQELTGPKIAIVVLNWNGARHTRECLQSLLQMNYAPLRIFVVDNYSKEGPPLDRAEIPKVVELVRNSRNLGFSEGMNVGLRLALEWKAEIAVCINNDVVVAPEFAQEISKSFTQDRTAAAFAPKELDYHHRSRIVFAGGRIGLVRSKLFHYNEVDAGLADTFQETKMLCGACMIFNAGTLRRLGLLDPTYFFGFEDREYGLRILRGGGRIVFVPRARLWHKRAQATASSFNSLRAYFQVRNWMRFARREFSIWRRICLAFYLATIYLPFIALKAMSQQKAPIVLWALKGIFWHVNPRAVPTDDLVADLLARKPT